MTKSLRSSVPAGMARRAMLAAAVAGAFSARAWSAQPIRIGGTGMALATMREIGEAYTAAGGAPVSVLPSLGTSGGIAAVAAGAIELALAARPLSESEHGKGMRCEPYARTPVAFVSHPDTGIRSVTLREAADILLGRMTTWPGGIPVRLIRREPSDADWTLLRGLSADMADAVRTALQRPGLLTVATDQENADALERLPGSFGMLSIGQMRAEARRVAPMHLDGAPPTAEALASGQYGLARTLHVAWRDPSAADVVQFLAFLHAKPSADILTRLGHIPIADPDS